MGEEEQDHTIGEEVEEEDWLSSKGTAPAGFQFYISFLIVPI